jgi:hypothetical protein
MAWTEKIFAYCERAGDPQFWAEPFNAISNVAFLVAAIAAALLLAKTSDAPVRRIEWALIVLVFIIGIGSFLFHTYATRWASVADTAPIGIFMIGYLGYAMRRFLRAPYWAVIVSLALFIAALRLAEAIPCAPELLPITMAAGRPCFNGSLGYVPALAALLLMGFILIARGHGAGRLVLAAGLVFALSLTLRTIDFEFCNATAVWGRARGTHALWHTLNALLLFVLLAAAIRHGRAVPGRKTLQ